MIFQGLFEILDSCFSGIEIFYNNIDRYFLEMVSDLLRTHQDIENNLDTALETIIPILIDEFVEIGLYRAKVQNRLSAKFLTIKIEQKGVRSSIIELYEKKIAPLVYEIIMEQIIFYLVDDRAIPILLNFRKKGLITIDFIIELRDLKNSLENSPEKLEKLKRYIRIRDKIIIKFCENKEKIESLEDLDNSQSKIQLMYLIYKIIDFFDIQYFFNFSHLKEYLKNNFEDCMESIPLISLKNPDLCYCALYLANQLDININEEKVKEYLLNVYEDQVEEFEFPIIEATNQLFFFLKSTSLTKLWLTNEQINEIVKYEPKFFESQHLEEVETSQLAIILTTFAFLELFNKVDENSIKTIYEEIEKRITPEGIKQNINGFYSSEATFYVLFSNYVNQNLDKLKSSNILDNIVSKIYRNLEFLDFSKDMNMDLLTELFYSVESLRLFNCIKLKENIIHLVKYLFPEEIENKILNKTIKLKVRSKYLIVNRTTGETNYIFNT